MNHDMNATRHPPPIRPEAAFSAETVSDLLIIATQSRHAAYVHTCAEFARILDSFPVSIFNKGIRAITLYGRSQRTRLIPENRDIIRTFSRHTRKRLRFVKCLSCNCITHFFKSHQVSDRTVSGHLRDIWRTHESLGNRLGIAEKDYPKASRIILEVII